MAAAAILKNQKIAISQQRIDVFWPSRHGQPIKFQDFKNPRLRPWKMENAISQKPLDRFWWNLFLWCMHSLQIQNRTSIEMEENSASWSIITLLVPCLNSKAEILVYNQSFAFLGARTRNSDLWGWIFEPSEIQATKGSTIWRRARSLPPNRGAHGQSENKKAGTGKWRGLLMWEIGRRLGHYGDHPRSQVADRGTPSRVDKRVAQDREGATDKQCQGEGKLWSQYVITNHEEGKGKLHRLFPKTWYPFGYPEPALQQKTEERESTGKEGEEDYKTAWLLTSVCM